MKKLFKRAEKLAKKIEHHYFSFCTRIKITDCEIIGDGERFIFDVKPKRGTKINLIYDRAEDIRVALKLHMFQVFYEDLTIRIAVSEFPVKENSLRKMLPNSIFTIRKAGIPVALGYTVRGEMYFVDLVDLKHALYGGSTGSGKSVGLQSLVISIIAHQPVSRVNLLLFDIGANSLSAFEDVPHLAYPLIKDIESGIYVMKQLETELERRIGLSNEELQALPYLVVVVDEFVSFVANINDKEDTKSVTDALSNLLRRGRHGKIICILATQDPKAKNMMIDLGNITARMAFACAKYHNSVTILGESGAEKLQGKGAMLFKSPSTPEPLYVQGAYMSPEDISSLVQYINERDHDYTNIFYIPDYETWQESPDKPIMTGHAATYSNKELAAVIIWAFNRDNVSVNQIQKKYRMGDRADDVIEKLHTLGIVGPKFSKQPREVIPKCFEDVSEQVIEFLLKHKISEDDIRAAFITHEPIALEDEEE